MEQGKLKFTIGLARSGKSTYCNRWASFLEDMPTFNTLVLTPDVKPRVIVCSDDIRLAVHGERFNKDAEPMVWAIHTYMAKALLRRGFDIIVDGTNTTEDSLWRLLNIDPNATYVLFDTSVEECERRALASDHIDLVERGVIRRQGEQLQELKTNGLDNVVESIRERVKKRWGIS